MPRKRVQPRATVLPYDVLMLGASWGGVEVLSNLVAELPENWRLPVVIVQHQHPYAGNALQRILSRLTTLPVIDVEDKDKLVPAHVYIAPANYHLLIEQDGSFSLSLEAPVNFSRPSIDVTFSSLSRVYQQRCIGVVLTGANDDGAQGIKDIKAGGGYTIAQQPDTAEAPVMPAAAIATGAVDAILTPQEIIPALLRLLDGSR
ncbi:MAG: chemotaxis protein CheB [Pedobacter sp.]|nr:chemotaxis protein CheB [Pedobacter sp.]